MKTDAFMQCPHFLEKDKMLFCDSCDRGYHTFCVDLAALPKGESSLSYFCNMPQMHLCSCLVFGAFYAVEEQNCQDLVTCLS